MPLGPVPPPVVHHQHVGHPIQPRPGVGSRLELAAGGPGASKHLLHQIGRVLAQALAAEEAGKRRRRGIVERGEVRRGARHRASGAGPGTRGTG
jgi:hypothetical protein